MARQSQKPAPDQSERDAAIRERERNVLVDAGAGTGKTSILVNRLVDMLAPSSTGKSVPISRIAAITFTRKAAGELRLRIRERLLEELAESKPGTIRDDQLRDAIAGLDTAYVGTIHSFADRLLRLHPMEAQLSPSYEIAEDDSGLIGETFEVLIHAVENGTLASELAGSPAVHDADQITQTILNALSAGIKAESQEKEWMTCYGLDGLVEGFIRRRDVPPAAVLPAEFSAEAFRAAIDEFIRLSAGIRRISPGSDWILRTAAVLSELRNCGDPVEILHRLGRQFERAPRDVTKRYTFANDNDAWRVWKVFIEGDGQQALRDQLRAPLDRWMATRLVRLIPAILALYEKVKARRRQLDQLDLLIKLRDLLAGDKALRAEYQQMFDHILVDEFQDTDPLQAEIVLYLCEKEPLADRWQDVVLAGGKLTLVGDPKQSIYRFRRADVAMYDRVRGVVASCPHLEVKLSANFRSVPSLIDWFNDRFAHILGSSTNGKPFDPATGKVFQQPLAGGREGTHDPAVRILPFDFGDTEKHGADEYRQLEGQVLARYLQWLVELSGIEIIDPVDGSSRRIRFGDVAVLAISTWRLSFLFPWLDREGIPYASRGGRLFLEDPLHRQFILGLRAIADRSDGVAEAALLRPPFFAVDLLDLLRERGYKPENGKEADSQVDERVQRALEARELVRELRQRRFERSVASTARDLLDRTAVARIVALGPNGAQRITRLRELCLVLEQIAAAEGLDYDAATARLREWIDYPVELDPPYPVGGEAVQIMTVHQAKGLEFPVVIIWDGRGQWNTRPESFAWRVEHDGQGWMLDLDDLTWEEPPDLGIRQLERAYLDAERRRVIYVAATRARDLLVIPKAGNVTPERFVCGDLLIQAPESLISTMELYIKDAEPGWAREVGPPRKMARGDAGEVEKQVADVWTAASKGAVRPRFKPWSVTAEAHSTAVDSREEPSPALIGQQEERYGEVFGSVVHSSIGSVLRASALDIQGTVRPIAKRFGLPDHLIGEAEGDVARALEALRAIGLTRRPGVDLQLEYPVADAWDDGRLITGCIDLIAVADGNVDLLDFKTDAPPEGPVEHIYPQYLVQIRTYARLIEGAGILQGRRLRCGLLFTADGSILWAEG